MAKENSSGSNAESRRLINRIGDALIIIFLTLLCLTCIIPFLHLLAKSLSSNDAVLAKSVYLLPKQITFDAYTSIFKDGQLVHSMLYSVLVTAIFTLLGLATTIMAAYPLSRARLVGRQVLTFIIMFTMYFGAGLIPEYLLMSKLHLLDNMWVLILPLIFSPYNFLIMKSFFLNSIPVSLEESAYLDGASNFQILTQIVLPLSKPILATIGLSPFSLISFKRPWPQEYGAWGPRINFVRSLSWFSLASSRNSLRRRMEPSSPASPTRPLLK